MGINQNNQISYLTRFNLGFARFAFALAFLVELASIAPACFIETPCFLAIERCTDLNPGCALFAIVISLYYFYIISPLLFRIPFGRYSRYFSCRITFHIYPRLHYSCLQKQYVLFCLLFVLMCTFLRSLC